MTVYHICYRYDIPSGEVIGHGLYIEAPDALNAALIAAAHCKPGEAVESVTPCPRLVALPGEAPQAAKAHAGRIATGATLPRF